MVGGGECSHVLACLHSAGVSCLVSRTRFTGEASWAWCGLADSLTEPTIFSHNSQDPPLQLDVEVAILGMGFAGESCWIPVKVTYHRCLTGVSGFSGDRYLDRLPPSEGALECTAAQTPAGKRQTAIAPSRPSQAGIDFVAFERGTSVGGTWYWNTYPGCACDVPAHLYSLSFQPKPDWSRVYAEQPGKCTSRGQGDGST
jgi:hypothetical protein